MHSEKKEPDNLYFKTTSEKNVKDIELVLLLHTLHLFWWLKKNNVCLMHSTTVASLEGSVFFLEHLCVCLCVTVKYCACVVL